MDGVEIKNVDGILENFEKGNYLGTFKIYFEAKAVNIKDYQKFRANAIRRFGGDDWRYLKYLLKQDEVLRELLSLPRHQIKPKAISKDQNGKESNTKLAK